MSLNNSQIKAYRTIGHKLHPIITVADRGVTETIHAEIERALNDHELIKIKLVIADRQAKSATAKALCEEHGADLVQSIGHVILIHRAAKKPNPDLSNLLRPL